MKIHPDCTISRLSDCPPGALVRLLGYGHGTNSAFGFVAEYTDNQRAVIVLQEGLVEFLDCGSGENWDVLLYRSDYEIFIDQQGPFEGHANNLFDKDGCIIRNQSTWLLNCQSTGRNRFYSYQYDLIKHSILTRQGPYEIGVFGKWSLFLLFESGGKVEKTRVYSFEHTDR